MRSTSAEVQTTVHAPLEKAFAHIVPIDLQTRTVLLSDGSSAQEALRAYQFPSHFAYTVSGFTGILRFLAKEARGEWWFEQEHATQATAIRWRYEFISRAPVLEPIVCLITQRLWKGYMRKALRMSKAQVESIASV